MIGMRLKVKILKKSLLFLEGKADVIIEEDEEFKNVNFDKFNQLKPVFQREGGSWSDVTSIYLYAKMVERC